MSRGIVSVPVLNHLLLDVNPDFGGNFGRLNRSDGKGCCEIIKLFMDQPGIREGCKDSTDRSIASRSQREIIIYLLLEDRTSRTLIF